MDAGAQARALTDWYASHGRDLPWRHVPGPPDPWRVLVTELLLQQTRVETILPRYQEILGRIPDPAACARLNDADLDALWAGLGYYSRARNLRRAARIVVAEHDGVLPDDPEALRALPGIGPYTQGAVLAIAHDRPIPGVDGNIARVYGRLHGIEEVPAGLKRGAADWLGDLYRHGSPRRLMQAVMDLGATVCTPRRPTCGTCPLEADCTAATWADPAATPLRPRRKPRPVDDLVHAWITDGERLFLEGREPGLLGDRPAPPSRLLERPPESWTDAMGAAELRAVGSPYRHTFTHRHWDVTPALYRWPGATPPAFATEGGGRVVALDELERLGLPTAFLKGRGVLAGL